MRVVVTGGSGFIGTNLLDELLRSGAHVVNCDIAPPIRSEHRKYWQYCDLMSAQAVKDIFAEFSPTHVVHLAARTDTGWGRGFELDSYEVNIAGLHNVVEACESVGTVERLVHTSTQFVVSPEDASVYRERHYSPFTNYGESKARSEELLWEASIRTPWIIVRPTTIWGPWAYRYVSGLFRMMSGGLYFHPNAGKVLRSYGYVENVVWQVRELMVHRAPRTGSVLYVGDEPLDLNEWVDQLSIELCGHPARRMPLASIRAIALFGDAVKRLGGRFPISSSRLRSMTEDYVVPMEPTLNLVGRGPWQLREAVSRTIAWYKSLDDQTKPLSAPA